ncbi:MAG: acyl-CoA dehydrogenase family protein [Halanaerobiales bacterium]|nr:acyl-CoA dehydrogenase family protein [Halanaerobiales bacterium]
MNISLTTEQKEIIQSVRVFTDVEIRPFATEFEENQGLPRKLIEKLAAKGYLGATFPKKYGGLELDPITDGLLTEEIGKGCCNTRGLLTVHDSLVGESILKWGTEEQKNKWISFGDIADIFLVIASDEGKVTAFIVERERGVVTRPIKGLLGGRASHIAEVEFNDIIVPEENVLGNVGTGFAYIVSTALDHGRYSIAWAGVAIAQAALEAMLSYSRERSQFGQKLRTFQLIQEFIGDAVTKIHAALALCLHAGKLRKSGDPDAIIETSLAKYFTSKVAMEVAIDAVQVQQQMIAGYGIKKYYPLKERGKHKK